jgi:hypothetical protein
MDGCTRPEVGDWVEGATMLNVERSGDTWM